MFKLIAIYSWLGFSFRVAGNVLHSTDNIDTYHLDVIIDYIFGLIIYLLGSFRLFIYIFNVHFFIHIGLVYLIEL